LISGIDSNNLITSCSVVLPGTIKCQQGGVHEMSSIIGNCGLADLHEVNADNKQISQSRRNKNLLIIPPFNYFKLSEITALTHNIAIKGASFGSRME
jgi:hypothetical protein